MMRFNKILVLLVTAFFLGCETEPILFRGPYHVRFTETSLVKKETYKPTIEIEVHIVGPVMSEDLKLGYEISGTAREGIDYVIIGTKNFVSIKKGEYFGFIQVQLINNANNILRTQDLTFTLRTVNNSKLEVGQGASEIGNSFTLVIQDDCLLAGSYSGVKNVFDIPVEGITITSNDCETYLLSNWNIDILSPPFDYSLTFIDNSDNTLTIEEQESGAKIKGKGIIDPISRKITITLVFLEYDNEELSIILTPN
jgi:hypothetical protein